MSRINGEKARANITRRRRTAQREIDRARLAELKVKPASAEKAVKAEKPKESK